MPSNTFVMVPVPEALIHDVVQLIHKLNLQGGVAGSIDVWDQAAMEQYFLAADEDIRSFLSVVARGTLAGKRVTDQMAADFMQLGMRDTFEVARRIRDSVSSARRVQLVEMETIEETLPSGRIRHRRILTMQPDHARMIRVAERAAQQVEEHPLEGSAR